MSGVAVVSGGMCGFVAVVGASDVATEIHLGLQTLQHRGQDSAGIATMQADGSRFHTRRGLGIAAQAITAEDLRVLVGPAGVGHVRYPTIGRGVLDDAQPFFYRQPGVLMAHNGNITNYARLKEGLLKRSVHLLSHCDVEPVLCEFAAALMEARAAGHTIADAVAAARSIHQKVRGAYSLAAVMMLDGLPTLMVLRDPNGVRPVTIGTRPDGAAIASSESVVLDVLGYTRIEEPKEGEVVFLRAGQEPIRFALRSEKHAPCVFEFIYFARPDSVMDSKTVYDVRIALGRALATRLEAKGIGIDVAIPIPDTARPAATAISEQLHVPLREGFIKNRYTGRTFIMPDRLTRDGALRLKLNLLPGEFRDRRVLLVDDSIVRGTTLERVLALVRAASPREVHLAIHAPPVRHPCFYGIDMSTEEELFARRFAPDQDTLEREAAKALGVDSLTFLTVAGMNTAFGSSRCGACFDGAYPEPIDAADQQDIATDRRSGHT